MLRQTSITYQGRTICAWSNGIYRDSSLKNLIITMRGFSARRAVDLLWNEATLGLADDPVGAAMFVGPENYYLRNMMPLLAASLNNSGGEEDYALTD